MTVDPGRRGGGTGASPALAVELPPAPVLSPSQFWGLFAAAWVAYAGLMLVEVLLRGGGIEMASSGAFIQLLPLVIPSVAIAWHRKRLLRPRATIGRFIGHLALVGLLYAVCVAAIGSVIVAFMPEIPETALGNEPWAIVAVLMVAGLFLYLIFMGFMVWADSLERVQESREIATREAVLRAEAEAKAVRAQFNPHFVFNTLHSLILLVRKDPDTAERAIEDVAGLIRYASTLQRRKIDQVPLGKELDFAKRYVSLEKLRLADRLDISWEIGAELEDLLVPAFALQTLMENSIKHGIAPKPEGGSLRIGAAIENGDLHVVVSDDGLGADDRTVLGNGGSGLELLRRRLDSVYDGAARLEWETEPGYGFTTTLRLPVRRSATPGTGS